MRSPPPHSFHRHHHQYTLRHHLPAPRPEVLGCSTAPCTIWSLPRFECGCCNWGRSRRFQIISPRVPPFRLHITHLMTRVHMGPPPPPPPRSRPRPPPHRHTRATPQQALHSSSPAPVPVPVPVLARVLFSKKKKKRKRRSTMGQHPPYLKKSPSHQFLTVRKSAERAGAAM